MSKKWRVLKDDEVIQEGDIISLPVKASIGKTVAQLHESAGVTDNYLRHVNPKRPSKWIGVNDSLPTSDRRDVLARTQDKEVYKAWIDPSSGIWHSFDHHLHDNCSPVTHWRELPKFQDPKSEKAK